MDRKGNKKIGYILWALSAVFLVMSFSFFSFRCKEKIYSDQLKELVVIYPDIERELKDNFSFYQDHINRLELAAMATMVSLVLISGGILVLMEKREKRKTEAVFNNEFDLIYEQLQRFIKGNFEILPSLNKKSALEKTENVHEKLKELSYYYSDLKLRLQEEENNTKALITNISHQLKTPLASIRMCNELIKSSELSENEIRDFLAAEAREIERMEVLLGELVKLSRLENNMIQIKPVKNSLKPTISEAVSQIFMKAHAKNIEICVDMEKDIIIP